MRVSLNWIKRLLGTDDLGISPADLQQLLTLRVAEVEPELERIGPSLDGIVVGRVMTCVQHPNAERLRLTTVDVGAAEALPIVCGAPNVAVGQLVAVATVGATVSLAGPDGVRKAIVIKEAKLRGEVSRGMICAEDELGLGTSHDGIMVLSGSARAGTPLATVLGGGDTVLVIDNHGISHRPDLWGHWGWAREIAAILGRQPPADPNIAHDNSGSSWSATLEDPGCTTYAGAIVTGVANTASPAWMCALLNAVGVRPLGLLVDVTNFVMLELGEPMHAFDRREIAGTRIVVRNAAAGEPFQTLDGKVHKLLQSDLLIADDKRALALAGIMGGEASKVRDDTDTVLLEAAVFRAERIRRTRIRTGLTSDSSARFEKGLYPELAIAGLNRAIALLTELCPGARVSDRFIAGAAGGERRTVEFTPKQADQMIGMIIPGDIQLQLLHRLGFSAKDNKVTVPWWRAKDMHCSADVIEEVARLHGFHHITAEVPRLPAAAPALNPLRSAEHRARAVLSAQGWDEVATYSFTSDAWTKLLEWDEANLIRLANPLSMEQTVLRRSLIPTLAEAVGRNRKHANEVAIYEIGKRYGLGIAGAGKDEELVISGACASASDKTPFFAARDGALALLRGLGYQPRFTVSDAADNAAQPGRAVTLMIGELAVGTCHELSPNIRRQADCPERVGAFTIEIERIVSRLGTPKPIAFATPSRFPAVDRDFNWVCPDDLPYGRLAELSRKASGDLCAGVELVSIYRGDQLPPNQKAVTVRVLLQSHERTLDEGELQKRCDAIKNAIEKQTPARLRV
jgi:phenylalanyl-tRNA synthetase beta chain